MPYQTPASDRIAEYGLNGICEDILDGVPYRQIASKIGVSEGALRWWLSQDVARSARVNECRVITAGMWDERSDAVIEAASDQFELEKAKQLSHHYRWRASKIAPSAYGDKRTLAGDPENPLVVETRNYAVAPEQAKSMDEWQQQATQSIAPEGE